MPMHSQKIILASQSPRRKQLLNQIGISPFCLPVDINEDPKDEEIALDYCMRLATEKASAGWRKCDQRQFYLASLGSDTIVVLKNQILGKPRNKKHAFQMLSSLSGQIHDVITAVALDNGEKHKVVYSTSKVEFCQLTQHEIEEYVDSQEPMDKAGSYGIQGKAAQWIKNISGSYSGIMGLPLYETVQLIKGFEENE